MVILHNECKIKANIYPLNTQSKFLVFKSLVTSWTSCLLDKFKLLYNKHKALCNKHKALCNIPMESCQRSLIFRRVLATKKPANSKMSFSPVWPWWRRVLSWSFSLVTKSPVNEESCHGQVLSSTSPVDEEYCQRKVLPTESPVNKESCRWEYYSPESPANEGSCLRGVLSSEESCFPLSSPLPHGNMFPARPLSPP